MLRNLIVVCFLIFVHPFSVAAQNSEAILKQVLDFPAPPASLGKVKTVAAKRPPEFFNRKNPPPDDAPMADLLDYWVNWNPQVNVADFNRVGQMRPTPAVLERIAAELRSKPEKTIDFLAFLRDSPEYVDLVKNNYQAISGGAENAKQAAVLKKWLTLNSDLYLDDLHDLAAKTRDVNHNTGGEAELFALARLDWERAKPILERLENDSTNKMARVSAMWAIYRRAVKENDLSEIEIYRGRLKALVENRAEHVYIRDKAMDALVLSGEWTGRDEWYLSLLSDETLYLIKGERGIWTGLTTLPSMESEEKWIPIMLKLLESPDQNVKNAAVRNLMKMRLKPTRENLTPLLPWLDNPNWAKSPDGERRTFIALLGETDVPESVPGLINVLLNEKDFLNAAVNALARYKDARAIPALKIALTKVEGYQKFGIVDALFESGGFTLDEQVAALELAAELVNSMEKLDPSERVDVSQNARNSTEFILAGILVRGSQMTDELIVKIYERIHILDKTEPATAARLRQFLQNSKSGLVEIDLIRRLGTNQIDAESIVEILARRATLQTQKRSELLAVRGKNPLAQGLSAVILEDQAEIFSLLNNPRAVEAQIAILAAARLIHFKLPVPQIAPWLKHPSKTLALAAERYLETEDSPEAQKILAASFNDKIRISGARHSFNPAKFNDSNPAIYHLFESLNFRYDQQDYELLEVAEEKLRGEVAAQPELETIYSLLSPRDTVHQIDVRIFRNRAVLKLIENKAYFRERNLTAKELEFWQNLIAQNQWETAKADLDECNYCPHSEFVILNRRAGRRVFAAAENSKFPFESLLADFQRFGEYKLHYHLQDKIPAAEILVADESRSVINVWTQNGEVKVLLEEIDRTAEGSADSDDNQTVVGEDSAGELVAVENSTALRYQSAKTAKKSLTWYKLNADKTLGNAVSSPVTEDDNSGASSTNAFVTEIVENERYQNARVTADGKWLIAYNIGEKWDAPRSLVRINLLTKKEEIVKIPDADDLRPLAYPASSGKVIIRRAKSDGYSQARKNVNNPPVPEYFLLDAATGAFQKVIGEFRPLEEFNSWRQEVKPNGDFYAAIYDRTNNKTIVGLYETAKLAFQPIIELPEIQIESTKFRIDETGGKIYLVYDGHLLAIPLPVRK